jgi:transcriptional regulator with XRE-family HTH domain
MKHGSERPRHFPFRLTPFIPAIVVDWRRHKGFTQRQLARAAGLSVSTLKKIEAGRKQGPWIGSLEQICEALGITLLEMMAGAERLATQAWGRGGNGRA